MTPSPASNTSAMRRLRGAALVLAIPSLAAGALLTGAAAPAAASGSLPGVLTQLKPAFQVKPAEIDYTGDGTAFIGGTDGTGYKQPGHIHWITYTATRATGSGLVWLDSCTPSCAGGTFQGVPVSLVVSDAKNGHFLLLTLSYSYHGKRVVDHRKATYFKSPVKGDSGTWEYTIP